jgi:hypothetical protein
MSTRSFIMLKDGKRTYKIYRHSDGYPEGVISDLDVCMKSGGRFQLSDPEYFLANFIFYAKLDGFLDKDYGYETENSGHRSWELGYGVCCTTCHHGDEQYLYMIDCRKGTIKIYECNEEELRTKRIKPMFDGPLAEAIKKWSNGKGCAIDGEFLQKMKEKK